MKKYPLRLRKTIPALFYHIKKQTAVGRRAVRDPRYFIGFALYGIFGTRKAWDEYHAWWNGAK